MLAVSIGEFQRLVSLNGLVNVPGISTLSNLMEFGHGLGSNHSVGVTLALDHDRAQTVQTNSYEIGNF